MTEFICMILLKLPNTFTVFGISDATEGFKLKSVPKNSLLLSEFAIMVLL